MKIHNIEKAVIRILAVSVCLLSTMAFAEEKAPVAEPFRLGDYEFKADPELGYQYVSADHRSAKLNQYRDLESGVEFSGNAKMFRDSYYMGLGIKNAGKTNQEYNLTGGQYDKFKYKVYYNALVHNTSFDGHTYFTGVGTSHLSYTDHPYYGPTTTASSATGSNDVGGVVGWSNWTNAFDFGLKRKTYGATGALSLAAPFFVDFGVERSLTTGTGIIGSGSSMELPTPIDYANNTGFVEGAYRKDNISASIRYDISNFLTKDNYLYYMSWKNPAADLRNQDLVDHLSLAPSSRMTKVTVDSVVKDLPFDSSLNFHGGLSTMTDNVTLDSKAATKTAAADTLSAAVFAGNMQYKKADLSFVSRPMDKLNTRAYLGYFQNANTSNIIVNTTSTGSTYQNSLYNYHKSNGGFDAGYRLPMESKLKGGYQYVSMFRPQREDALSSHDHNFDLKVSNGYFDFMDMSLKAEVLSRTTEYEQMGSGATADHRTNIFLFMRPYDAASKLMWKVTAETDLTPMDNLAVDISYSQRKNNYRNTRIGKTGDLTHEAFADAGYTFKNGLRLNGFMDVEKTVTDSKHRFLGTSMEGNPDAGDYITPTKINPMAFNWDGTETGTTYGYGLTAEYPVMNNFNLGLSFVQDASSGSRAFSADPVVQAIVQFQDLGNIDKIRHSMFNLKGTYAINTKFSATLGFMFDKMVYEDDSYANYEFKTEPKAASGGAAAPSQQFTGFGSDNSYIGRVTYVSLTYNL